MSLSEIIAALGGLQALGMQEISLDGGEALAHPQVERVVDWLSSRGIIMRLNTNGVLVRRKLDVVRRMQKLKVSLDGPRHVHDALRGAGAFEAAIAALETARAIGVPVEFTCAVGTHNARELGSVLDLVESIESKVLFQPVRPSLFQGIHGHGEPYALSAEESRVCFAQIEAFKHAGRAVLNGWASLRHFRAFPHDQSLPCAAGWINVTLDPEGNLYHCGQVDRADKSNNVVKLGAKLAFERLIRQGCSQCWCARVVEENTAWGGRFDRMLPPFERTAPVSTSSDSRATDARNFDVPAGTLVSRARPARS